jgi:hypothetical protein
MDAARASNGAITIRVEPDRRDAPHPVNPPTVTRAARSAGAGRPSTHDHEKEYTTMTNQTHRDQINATATEIARRNDDGRMMVSVSTKEVVELLQASGLSDAAIAGILESEGVEPADVAGYGVNPPVGQPTPFIKVGITPVHFCVRPTCNTQLAVNTIEIKITT